MAPLYKRYIPPKPTISSPVDASKTRVDTNIHDRSSPVDNEKKRKRERTQDEIAERKAKKLKKKGVDPATVLSIQESSKAEDRAPAHATEQEAVAEVEEVVEAPAQGEFAHIKSAKKRHKLEKEARKARKDAEKTAKTDDGVEVVSQEHQATAGSEKGARNHERVNGQKHEHDEAVTPNMSDEEATAEVAKRKKRRKDRDIKEADGVALALDGPTASRTDREPSEQDIVGTAEPAPQPQKRRHKLEAVLQNTGPDEPSPEDDASQRKHTGILGKFQKSTQRSAIHPDRERQVEQPKSEQKVVRDLELPQRERSSTPEFQSVESALPPWLAKPTVVSIDDRSSFEDLALEQDTVDRLTKLGFRQALPVQQALVPLLLPPNIKGSRFLPGTEDLLPDVAVGAPTGSGKTIAYLLPITEALRRQRIPGRLSALIVVPTRELVLQVAAVAESLVKGSGVKVGMASGAGKFADEQARLIKRGQRYDPSGYQQLMFRARMHFCPPDDASSEFEAYLDSLEQEDPKDEPRIRDAVEGLVEHVPTYESAVDILIATPGRLLEHVSHTLGFNLVHLQWLVLDEADKLLDNQNEDFLESLNTELTRARTLEEQDARERYLRLQGQWDDLRERRLRKVVLSATMTRDVSKLSMLKLRRPQMIVVRGHEESARSETTQARDYGVKETADGFELPSTLVEYCIPVGDGSEKPLVAVELLSSLSSKIFGEDPTKNGAGPSEDPAVARDEDGDSSSESGESSIVSSDDSSSSSEDGSSDKEEIDDGDASDLEDGSIEDASTKAQSPSMPIENNAATGKVPTVLIFTSSNESATRLSHLLKGLRPDWSKRITTLIKAKPGKARIRAKKDEPAVVVSTDRAARGLDNFNDRPITHVIQYDVPRSITGYVHRVGRTARAGRTGQAWTLYTHAEARWFVNDITKASNVKRSGAVERVKLFMEDEQLRQMYQKVLAGMREEVYGEAK